MNASISIDKSLAILRNRCFVRENDVNLVANQLSKFGFRSLKDYKKSFLWKVRKNDILKCINNVCNICGSNERLSLHHKNYFNVGEEKVDDVSLLCFVCHFNAGLHRIHRNLHSFHFFTPSKSKWPYRAPKTNAR